MDKELYIGVDVSKQTLDLAYYDGESIDWKKAHIKVSNNNAGFKKIGSWVAKVSKGFDIVLFCMEYTGEGSFDGLRRIFLWFCSQ